MSAVNWYAHPETAWSDEPECVDQVIRALCIELNDNTPEDEMEGLIGPHLFAPLGTEMGFEMSVRRGYKCADWALNELIPVISGKTTMLFEAAGKAVERATTWAAFERPISSAQATQHAARYVGRATGKARTYRQKILNLILELCEMGREDINTTRTKEETISCLNEGCFVKETTNA